MPCQKKNVYKEFSSNANLPFFDPLMIILSMILIFDDYLDLIPNLT